jgi:ABC-type multidrug transport system ATPase subunit
MEEADRLAGRLCIVDQGKIVAEGKPSELKAKIGLDKITLQIIKDPAVLTAALKSGEVDVAFINPKDVDSFKQLKWEIRLQRTYNFFIFPPFINIIDVP